jgi:hypothetical protein
MARKKKVAGSGAALKPEPKKKEDPSVIFENWLKKDSTPEQQQAVSAADKYLIGIQTDRKDLRREWQPLRIGMELDKVRLAITGETGPASPQTTTGRIWGAYVDSHLKDAGYSKASAKRYVGMIVEARIILPDDTLITRLLDYTDDKTGMVMLTGGKVEKPFGKYTLYMKSNDVQEHIKDGKVDLGDLSVNNLVANVFSNPEPPPTALDLWAVAVNTVMRKFVARANAKLKPGKKPLELDQVGDHARDGVQYVVDALLTLCKCEDMKEDTFDPIDESVIKTDKLLTLEAAVNEVNENKKQKASEAKPPKMTKKGKLEASVRQHKPAKVLVNGKYTARKNPKPDYANRQSPWEIFVEGTDKPVALCTDSVQAEQHMARLVVIAQAKDDAVQANEQSKDAHSDRPPSPAAQQDEETRKQRAQKGHKQYDAG